MSAHYPFSLPPLPYPYDALAPQLDRVTLQLHHDRLFGSYTDSLNSLLASWPPYHDWPLPQLILRWPELPPDIRQAVRIAAGGVLAHTFVFESMTRPGTTQPDELLLGAIRRSFGSVPGLLQTLKNTALQEPGSGYVCLAGDGGGTLFVCRTADQDTPLPLFPLLCLDLWEHAYYLTYQNRRETYVDAWLTLIDWESASSRYGRLRQNRPPYPCP